MRLQGELRGIRGLVPSNFLEDLTDADDALDVPDTGRTSRTSQVSGLLCLRMCMRVKYVCVGQVFLLNTIY